MDADRRRLDWMGNAAFPERSTFIRVRLRFLPVELSWSKRSMSPFWDSIKRRLRGDVAPVVGAKGVARQAPVLLTMPAVGELAGVPQGLAAPAAHEAPRGRPGWWSAALPQARLLYPDDALNLLLEEMRR